MPLNDAHCHFFSQRFFETIARDAPEAFGADAATVICDRLGWDPPGDPARLADRWVGELDRHQVARAAIIASVPGDEESVATAVALHPASLVGFFMVNPVAPDAVERVRRGLGELGLRGVCLFPAMQRYPLLDERVLRVVEAVAAARGVLFVHCGVLTVGVRKKLGLPSRFEGRFGRPMDVQALAATWPSLPVIIPHFGAGCFAEALMAAEMSANIHLDTSSSNGWIRYHAGLTLTDVFRQALLVVGASRLLFGTDSSFFPRGWQRPILDAQMAALEQLNVSPAELALIQGGNFDRLFPSGLTIDE